jgi:DNA-binding transcriptional LysR family regulator
MHPLRPSLNALRAFEATARLHSFSAAAQELSVTHGAISRHIRTLEDHLGTPLLLRTAQGAWPTSEGQRLAEALTTAFGIIQASVDTFQPGPLTLSCSESIMMYWLIPRLARFKHAHADIDLSFNMSHGPIDFAREKISVAIRLSSISAPKDAVSTDVASEWIGPVCTPDYLTQHPIRSHADLAQARLMVSNTRPGAWTEWASCLDDPMPELPIAQSFDHFFLLIQGARCGLGWANVPRMLVLPDLESGALVAPLGFVRGPNRIQLWVPHHVQRQTEVIQLSQWLDQELRRDAGNSEGNLGVMTLRNKGQTNDKRDIPA